MKKVIIALVLLVGSFGAMSASADSRFSFGFVFGHHGEVITHFGISNHHGRHHESHHERRHRLARERREHFRFGHRYRTTYYDRHHSDPYYHHIHGFHHLCDHGDH